ncbi:Hypothetical predicted protein [Cloeon dipterum]|uniref:Uncharacterized protein n=1 Tax=Cloeon dipterum TaxID=197152 RepID=A0A8S1CWQ2_9INSE|nr:Hypothetical predicted protein [Cloeon dipterum]
MHHNFHAEEGYGNSSQRASLEELNLMGLHSRRESKEHRQPSSSYKTFASVSISEPEEVDKAIFLRQETASATSVLCGKSSTSTPTTPDILKTRSKPATNKLPPNYKIDENKNMPGSNSDSSNARKVKKSKKVMKFNKIAH